MTVDKSATPWCLDAEACIAMLKGKAGIKELLEKVTNPLATHLQPRLPLFTRYIVVFNITGSEG